MSQSRFLEKTATIAIYVTYTSVKTGETIDDCSYCRKPLTGSSNWFRLQRLTKICKKNYLASRVDEL